MKRKFLILSATLAVIVCAALLQSCNSESVYEEPAYGYYTVEEINVIKAMAEVYGVDVEIDTEYYGEKLTLEEIEKDLMKFSNLPGEYELVPNKDSTEYYFVKKEVLSRTMTRSAELENIGNFVIANGELPFGLTVSWRFATKKGEKDYVSVSVASPLYIQGGGSGELTRSFIRLNHTYSFYRGGTRYGRYNIAGTYYAEGQRKDFKITKVQD